ncbi:NADP-dependent oxidoreductase [Salinibacterium sp. ZJ450]|uniref:NADP-dependent oxidoreductase n=1 Tax=Salinibacterium sp. ZJ450 TaxID=2708338 RepID=UPI001424116F|nr:NADP-dependent oxidoreductase [Salinibacterium sp. ZJ450]
MARAARFHDFGEASVITIDDVPQPTPGAGQVRIRVHTSALNRADVKVRRGLMRPGLPKSLPSGLGFDAAGVIDEVGEGVTGFAPGDEVFALVLLRGLAEYAVARATSVARKPAALSWQAAGALATVGQTALDVVASQHLTDADIVMVSGATGGVGVLVAQLARLEGATVLGTASADNAEFLRSIGVIPVEYGASLAERILETGQDVTVVFDQAGPDTVRAALELGIDPARINTTVDEAKELGVQAVGQGKADPERLEILAEMIADGSIVLPIAAEYPLTEIVAAFERFERGHVRGKISIIID